MRMEYLEGIALPMGGVAKVDEVTIGGDRTVGLYPDQRGAQPVAIDFLRAPNLAEDMFRTLGQSHVAESPIDPLTTAIVLGKQFQPTAWVNLFFPPTTPLASSAGGLARSLSYQFPMWGTEHLDEYDTRLPEGVPYSVSGLDVAWLQGKMEPHGWASIVTLEESARAAASLNWVARKASLPMTVVNRAMQFNAARRLLDTTAEVTYATGHVLNKTAGTEWDQPGVDMQADAETALQAIASKVTTDRRAITCVMSESTYGAALRNEGFKAWHTGIMLQQSTDYSVNETRLAQYLGVGEVQIINPTGAGGRALFDDVCWFIIRSPDLEDWRS